MGAARRAWAGICEERFQSNQSRLAIKTFSVMKPSFSCVSVDLSLHLSHHSGKISQEDRY